MSNSWQDPPPAVPRELVGALAAVFDDMSGPSHVKLDNAIEAAGIRVPKDAPNKPTKVRIAFESANRAQARVLVEELIHIIRDGGYYELPMHEKELRRTQSAAAIAGGTLTDEGYFSWTAAPGALAPTSATSTAPPPKPGAASLATPVPVPAPAPAPKPSAVTAYPAVTFVRPGTQHPEEPTHERLLSMLRRVPGSMKALVGDRRKGQEPLRMANEYDLQDAVEFALRLVYDDVRPEERGPSVAGGSTTPDFLLPTVRTAVEIKVTKPGRKNSHVRDEILVDSTTYLAHPGVHRLVFVVYDLAGTITNPTGFEHDLSQPINDHPRDTLVVDWPHANPAMVA